MSKDSPKILMTLLVRDEEDILADNITFHRFMGVDHFIVTDNLSKDATPAIIARFAEQGWVTPLFEPSDDYDQSRWVTRMARLAACEHVADWVINCDADEFWMPPTGSLRDFYGSVQHNIVAIESPRHNFICPVAKDGVWHERMLFRYAVSLNHVGRPLPPKVAHRGCPDVVVHQGNHSISGIIGEMIQSQKLEILHFPIRSQRQFENKIRNGGAAYQRNTKLPVTIGRGWRELYALFQQEGSLGSYLGGVMMAPDAIAAGLGDGTLIEDTRLADYFRTLNRITSASDR